MLDILFTFLAYMLVPFIIKKMHIYAFDKKDAFKIALWNSIIVGIIFIMIRAGLNLEQKVSAAAVIYFFINKYLLNRGIPKEAVLVEGEESKNTYANQVVERQKTKNVFEIKNDDKNKNIEHKMINNSVVNNKVRNETIKCANCKYSIPKGSLFCPYCGEEIRFFCSECGSQVIKSSKFCNICGLKLKDFDIEISNEM